MNTYNGIGRLGADAEVKTSKSGERRFLTFSICVNVYNPESKKQDLPLWLDCASYLPRIVDGGLPALLTRGKEIAIRAELRPNTFTPQGSDRPVTKIQFVVDDITLLRDAGGNGQATAAPAQAPDAEPVPF